MFYCISAYAFMSSVVCTSNGTASAWLAVCVVAGSVGGRERERVKLLLLLLFRMRDVKSLHGSALAVCVAAVSVSVVLAL